MEENNIIICEHCYEENETTRNTCKSCGAKLYKGKETKDNRQSEEYLGEERTNISTNDIEIENPVAQKFSLVVNVIKVIGYVSAIILACYLWSESENFLFGGGVGISIAIATWLSILIFEAIAEGLNLLQEIANKL